MATFRLFISVAELKQMGYLDENTDENLLQRAIKMAQEIHVRDSVGSGIYDDIVDGLANSNETASYNTLRTTYIKPALIWWVHYEITPIFNYHFTNKGIMNKTGENQQGGTLEIVKFWQEFFKDKAEYYTERLIKYLIANTTTFTKYTNPGSTADTIFPSQDNYDIGWVIGGVGCGRLPGIDVDRGNNDCV